MLRIFYLSTLKDVICRFQTSNKSFCFLLGWERSASLSFPVVSGPFYNTTVLCGAPPFVFLLCTLAKWRDYQDFCLWEILIKGIIRLLDKNDDRHLDGVLIFQWDYPDCYRNKFLKSGDVTRRWLSAQYVNPGFPNLPTSMFTRRWCQLIANHSRETNFTKEHKTILCGKYKEVSHIIVWKGHSCCRQISGVTVYNRKSGMWICLHIKHFVQQPGKDLLY